MSGHDETPKILRFERQHFSTEKNADTKAQEDKAQRTAFERAVVKGICQLAQGDGYNPYEPGIQDAHLTFRREGIRILSGAQVVAAMKWQLACAGCHRAMQDVVSALDEGRLMEEQSIPF